ncbi:MAG: shikimate dehydrogenase [Nitrosomonas sp.]|nr:shikimate dehydrogenase [Nitrosomonas sp.]MBK7365001.1 shikimate dehydrogenase [Nitrosomonas sp.]
MTDRYAVIGNPIHHSKSPFIHREFARQTQQDMCYEAILSPLDQFAHTVRSFQNQGGKGLNVTLPFKIEAFRLATQLTERAQSAQAVNTLQFRDHNEIIGDNTDGTGLVRDIEVNQAISIRNKNILLMGAGGAARGVILPLLRFEPDQLTIANRTLDKAIELQRQFACFGNIRSASYQELTQEKFDIIINATSASLANKLPPLTPNVFAAQALAYDMMYGKQLTPFLQFARHCSVSHLVDGIGMLVEQAAESFYLWRGIRPETETVIRMLKNS